MSMRGAQGAEGNAGPGAQNAQSGRGSKDISVQRVDYDTLKEETFKVSGRKRVPNVLAITMEDKKQPTTPPVLHYTMQTNVKEISLELATLWITSADENHAIWELHQMFPWYKVVSSCFAFCPYRADACVQQITIRVMDECMPLQPGQKNIQICRKRTTSNPQDEQCYLIVVITFVDEIKKGHAAPAAPPRRPREPAAERDACAAAAECDAGAATVEPVAMSRAQLERQLLSGDQKEQFDAALQAAAENSAAASDWLSSPAAAGVENAAEEDTDKRVAAVTIIENLLMELDALAAEKKELARRCQSISSIDEQLSKREEQDKRIADLTAQLAAARASTEESEQRAAVLQEKVWSYKEEADENKDYYERLEKELEKEETLLIKQKDVIADLTTQLAAARAKIDAAAAAESEQRVPLLKDVMTDTGPVNWLSEVRQHIQAKQVYYCPSTAAGATGVLDVSVDVSQYDDAQLEKALDSGAIMFMFINDDGETVELGYVRGVDPDEINKMDADRLRQLLKEHIKRANTLGMAVLADDMQAAEFEKLQDRLDTATALAKDVLAGDLNRVKIEAEQVQSLKHELEKVLLCIKTEVHEFSYTKHAYPSGFLENMDKHALQELVHKEKDRANELVDRVQTFEHLLQTIGQAVSYKEEADDNRSRAEPEQTRDAHARPKNIKHTELLRMAMENLDEKHVYTDRSLQNLPREVLEELCHSESVRGNALLDKVNSLKHELEISEQRVITSYQAFVDAERVKKEATEKAAVARAEKRKTKDKLAAAEAQNEEFKIKWLSQMTNADREIASFKAAEAQNEEFKIKWQAQMTNADREIASFKKKMEKLTGQIARMADADKRGVEERRQLKKDVKAEQKKTAAAQTKTAETEHALKEAKETIDALAGECLKFEEAKQEMKDALEKQQQEIDALKERPTAPYPTAPSGSECVICLVRSPTFAHVKCGHLIYCDTCAAEMNEMKDCPVCRQQFVQEEVHHLVKIYD